MDDLQTLIARLLAHRFLPRADKQVRRALTDDVWRSELDTRLAACGMCLLENPYAEHVAVGLLRQVEEGVFGGTDTWLNNNLGLSRDAVATLIVCWALIILPKRERQTLRREREAEGQSDMFGADKPMVFGEEVSQGIAETTLLADFGDQLGGKTRIGLNLGLLARLGFLERRNKMILEGPLLDVLIDYGKLAPRIIEGALAEVLAERSQYEKTRVDDDAEEDLAEQQQPE